MSRRSNGRPTGRLVIAGGLLILNLALLVLNLDKHRLLPVDPDPDETAAGDTTVTTPGADGAVAGESTLPPSTAADATTTTVDDWPGGHGPVPEGPPVPRVAVIAADGTVTLTGSSPNWATALKIVEFAGANLPGGTEVVDNQLTWHPDASTDTQSGLVVMDQAATFGVAGSEIDPSSTPGLDLTAEILSSRPSLFVVVIGHTDDQGDADVNAQLALDRANAVVDYLVDKGVIPGQLVVASAGEDDPFASNETEAGRGQNRRIELRFENFLIPPQ